MRRRRALFFVAYGIGIAFLAIPNNASGQFTLLQNYNSFSVGGSGSTYIEAPVINESGNTAFGVSRFPSSPGSYATKLYYGSGSSVTEVMSVTGSKTISGFSSFYGDRLTSPAINNSNQVAYGMITGSNSSPGTQPKINVWQGGTTTTVVTAPSPGLTTTTSQALSDAGSFVYTNASNVAPAGNSQTTVYPDGSLSTVSLANAVFSSVNANGDTLINVNNNVLSSLLYRPAGGSSFTNVTGANSVVSSISSTEYVGALGRLTGFSMNDVSKIAYFDGTGNLWLTDPSGVSTLLHSTPTGGTFYPEMLSLNNQGNVALSYDDGSVSGKNRSLYLLTSGSSDLVKILGPGDSFLGSTIQDIYFGTGGLNDLDEVALAYKLTNGAQGVAVLQVNVVPEAGTLILTGLGVMLAVIPATRRLRRAI